MKCRRSIPAALLIKKKGGFGEDFMKNERTGCNTELIYERDAYVTHFTSVVLDAFETTEGFIALELKESCFFPEGGGQSADEGFIDGCPVTDVQRVDGRVLHTVKIEDGKHFAPGQEVTGEVDFALRFLRMQNHIAEHLFCGIANQRFGYDNVGFHLSDVVTFDLDGPLTGEEIASIEEKCNEVIWENVPVIVHFPTPEEAAGMSFRSKLELEDGVRLVEIKGYDLCACCAPALRSTGEIGIIKVIDFMPHRGGTRITLIAGRDAYKDYRMLDEETGELMKLFSAKRNLVADAAADFSQKSLAMHAQITELKKEITALYIREVKDVIRTRNDGDIIGMIYPAADEVQSRNVINECVKDYDGILCIFRGNDADGYRYVCGRREAGEYSLKELAASMKKAFGGSGGGSEIMIQGSAPAKKEIIEAFFQKEEK